MSYQRGRVKRVIPLVVWLVLGAGLAALTSRVADWLVMTDELLYERLALSVNRLRSPLPHVHRELVPTFDQVYPLRSRRTAEPTGQARNQTRGRLRCTRPIAPSAGRDED
jgi:hypothetical protein